MLNDCPFNRIEAKSETEDVLQFMAWVSKCIFKSKKIDWHVCFFSYFNPVFEPGIICFCHTSLETEPVFFYGTTCQFIVECHAMSISVDIIEKRHIGVKLIARAYHNKVMLVPCLKGENKWEMRFGNPSAIVFYALALKARKL